MGLMRLVVHDRDRIPPGGLDHVYICGQDELPWRSRAYFSGNQLVIERNEDDSGRVCVPWRVAGSDSLLIGTSTLMERERPYLLEVELARGMLSNLRNQLVQWEVLGLVVPEPLQAQITEATTQFARAATLQDDTPEAARWAQRSITTTVAAMNALAAVYAEQAIAIRRAHPRPFVTWFGVHLGSYLPRPGLARKLATTFNMVSVPMTWRQIEATEGRRSWESTDKQIAWAKSAGMKVCAGPLIELDDRGVPEWTYLWEGDLASLMSFMLGHVRTTVERYRGKVHLWQVAARMTHGQALSLGEEARLQIAARAITTVRELDPTTPIVISFDQPWAEYLANEQLDLAPLHFADALVRADLGLSGLGLELNIGYHPRASIHRSPLAYSRLVDTWSALELPLLISLTLPSSAAEDPLANPKVRVVSGQEGEVSPQSQRDWIHRHVPLLLAKSSVQVVLWNQFSDAAPHHYPHGGLLDKHDKPKPALEALRKIRQHFLGAK
jgi:hypothetical protein